MKLISVKALKELKVGMPLVWKTSDFDGTISTDCKVVEVHTDYVIAVGNGLTLRIEEDTLEDFYRESSFEEMAIEAFELIDYIAGTETGGIEAPRILISAEEREDGAVAIKWQNPETCGLSDVRYHNTDLSVHEDVYSYNGRNILVNGNNPFDDIWFDECRKMVDAFYLKWQMSA